MDLVDLVVGFFDGANWGAISSRLVEYGVFVVFTVLMFAGSKHAVTEGTYSSDWRTFGPRFEFVFAHGLVLLMAIGFMAISGTIAFAVNERVALLIISVCAGWICVWFGYAEVSHKNDSAWIRQSRAEHQDGKG